MTIQNQIARKKISRTVSSASVLRGDHGEEVRLVHDSSAIGWSYAVFDAGIRTAEQ
jgi:hypothetical protein